jgi:hypothetical protein
LLEGQPLARFLTAEKITNREPISTGKETPVQARADPEVSRGLRLPDFKSVGI